MRNMRAMQNKTDIAAKVADLRLTIQTGRC
jgi:hypothetical protein